jgi:hypothetical protein
VPSPSWHQLANQFTWSPALGALVAPWRVGCSLARCSAPFSASWSFLNLNVGGLLSSSLLGSIARWDGRNARAVGFVRRTSAAAPKVPARRLSFHLPVPFRPSFHRCRKWKCPELPDSLGRSLTKRRRNPPPNEVHASQQQSGPLPSRLEIKQSGVPRHTAPLLLG